MEKYRKVPGSMLEHGSRGVVEFRDGVAFRCPCDLREMFISSSLHTIKFDSDGILDLSPSCGYLGSVQDGRPKNWCHFFLKNGEPDMCGDAQCPGAHPGKPTPIPTRNKPVEQENTDSFDPDIHEHFAGKPEPASQYDDPVIAKAAIAAVGANADVLAPVALQVEEEILKSDAMEQVQTQNKALREILVCSAITGVLSSGRQYRGNSSGVVDDSFEIADLVMKRLRDEAEQHGS